MSFNPIWEKIFKNNKWGEYPGEDLIRFVAKNFYSVKNRKLIRILEIGCGPGSNIWYCAKEGFTVYGIDGSETAINKCRDRLNREIPDWSGELHIGNIHALPLEDQQFDLVIDNECLSCNNFSNTKKSLLEIYRVLKKDGIFFSRTFSTDTWGYDTGKKIENNTYLPSEGPLADKGLIRFTDKNDIENLYSKRFSLIKIELIQRTMMNRKKNISEWIIEARKTD